MATISLVMIVKNEEKILEKNLETYKHIVDEFIIIDTGSTDKTRDIIKKHCKVRRLKFTDYVDTKNKALKKATGDYILFMDADEYFVLGVDKIRRYADDGVNCLSTRIIEGPKNIITNTYYRNRLWKNNGGWKFHGSGVHEVICGNGNIVYDCSIHVKHDHQHREDVPQERYEQYIEWLIKALEKDPKDSRSMFYLARTYKDLSRFDLAIDIFHKYLQISNNLFIDERWQSAYDMALCWKVNGEYDKVFECCNRAIEIDPRRAEAYNLKGLLYYNMQEWKQAIECYEKALSLPFPEDVMLFIDPQAYKAIPLDYLSICYDRLQNYKKSEELIEAWLNQSNYIDDRIVNNLYWVKSKLHQKIFMTLGTTPEPVYGGILNEKGVHGVETTYIELSEELVKLGHSVFLFVQCEEEHIYNGVYYIPYNRIGSNFSVKPDVLITSRWFDSLYFENNSKKIIWLQDAFFKSPDRPDAFEKANSIVCSSPWHKHYISERFQHGINANKLKIISLGIRKELFLQRTKKDPFKVFYSSNPDRGLYILLDMWEELTRKIPELKLHIYYGWDGLRTWSKDNNWQNQVNQQYNNAMERISQFSNISLKGRLTKKELAKEMLSGTLCLYPNNFWETFCLTALESQAAGVPTITTARGALSTTLNKDCNILITLDPYSKAYKDRFIQETVDLMEDRNRLNQWSLQCRDYALGDSHDWSEIVQQWEKLCLQ